jgi:hypothetical protein
VAARSRKASKKSYGGKCFLKAEREKNLPRNSMIGSKLRPRNFPFCSRRIDWLSMHRKMSKKKSKSNAKKLLS